MFFLRQKHVLKLIATKWCVRYSFTSKVLSGYFKEQFYPIYTAHYPINISTNTYFPHQTIKWNERIDMEIDLPSWLRMMCVFVMDLYLYFQNWGFCILTSVSSNLNMKWKDWYGNWFAPLIENDANHWGQNLHFQ